MGGGKWIIDTVVDMEWDEAMRYAMIGRSEEYASSWGLEVEDSIEEDG